jgi:hypothetical protein
VWFKLNVHVWHRPELGLVARDVGLPRAQVVAVWIAAASLGADKDARGSTDTGEFHAGEIAVCLDLSENDVAAILGVMREHRLLDAVNRPIDWLGGGKGPFRASRTIGSEWKRLREYVLKRDNFTCKYCGSRGGGLECDHIVPVSRGGDDHPDNLAAACRGCNRKKRDKLPDEWPVTIQ